MAEELPRKRQGAIYPKTLHELRDLSDEELIALHDEMVTKIGNYQVGLDYYPTELARREQERQTVSMVDMTRTIKSLTWVIGVLTLVNVVVVIASA